MVKFFKSIGRAVKKAAGKVGGFVKDNVGKVHQLAKNQKIASKLASRFHPGLGAAIAAAGYRGGKRVQHRSGRKGMMLHSATPARRGIRRTRK